jgi:dTDP-4-dehydrorhamnose 3,5-epimerase
MQFKHHSTIQGLVEIFPSVFKDERGYFFESFSAPLFVAQGLPEHFAQDNQSFSVKGVLRGLHFQREPHAQGKLVRVITGKVMDVVVDIRPKSPTFGHTATFVLDSQLQNLLYIPEGFAHGFLALEDSIFHYKCTRPYHKASEGGIIWNDPDLAIMWPQENPLVSVKDQELGLIRKLNL